MLSWVSNLFTGQNGGLSVEELEKASYKNPFSNYLPYIAYDPQERSYFNIDDTKGFIWECTPLSYAGDKSADILEGICSISLPIGSCIQFVLYADQHIEPIIDYYRSMKKRDNELVRTATEEFCKFLTTGVDGVNKAAGIPLRNYRLFVSVKVPVNDAYQVEGELTLEDIRNNIEERLRGAYLFPAPLLPGELLSTLRRLFNENHTLNGSVYNDMIPIRKQIINAETAIFSTLKSLRIGGRLFSCITPKSFPREVNLMQTNQLIGGIWGMINDTDQIRSPFLFAFNIIFHNTKTALQTKCDLVLQQQAAGRFAPSLKRKQEEYLGAVDQMDRGVKFMKVMPIFWTWGDQEKVAESISRAKRIWESHAFVMQEDRGILPILFVSSLPFGLYDKGRNIDNIDRHFIAPTSTISSILPIQSDFSGGGQPALITMGRKGQICTQDIFDKSANNHNFLVAATSGSGKSFFMNYLAYNYFANNAIVRIIDIGRSYEKLCKMLKGRYITFTRDSDICLNPFSNVMNLEEELSVIKAIIMQMAFSNTNVIPQEAAETSSNLISAAIKWAWSVEGQNATIDDVHKYLNEFPKHASDYDFDCSGKEKCAENFTILAHTLAFNLTEFTSEHTYGKWFNGKATFDIANDEFLVIELEHLKPLRELFNVVTFQLLNSVSRDLYLSSREKPRIIVFEEAAQFLSSAINPGDIDNLATIIEDGYRRARKYRGSFSVVSQSILDIKAFGRVGEVIWSNSAFKYFLESVDFEKARQLNLIDYDEFTMALLKSLKSNRPYYSELFADTPHGQGIMRLVVDPYSYYIGTSDAAEINMLDNLVARGMSYDEAIRFLIKSKEGGSRVD